MGKQEPVYELSKYEQYKKLVKAVKSEAATMTGDECSWEIQRRWAAHNKRPFNKPKPPKLTPSGTMKVMTADLPEKPPLPAVPPEGEPKKPVSPAIGRMKEEDATDGDEKMARMLRR